jgi:hypothetical protein
MLTAPHIYWYCYLNDNRLTKYEPLIAKDPYYAYCYAKMILKGRFKIAESLIFSSIDKLTENQLYEYCDLPEFKN